MGLVSKDDGWRMPDWLWERIEPLLPPPPFHPLGTHRSRVPDRDAMDAILLVLRTGMQWNALDLTGPASSSSSHRRFQNGGRRAYSTIWRQGLLEYDEQVGIAWDWLAANGAMTKAPLGGSKTGRIPPTERKRGEALDPHRGRGGAGRDRACGRQPPRPEAPNRDARVDPDRAPRGDVPGASGSVPGPRPRRCRRSTRSQSSTASRRTSARAARRSPTSCAPPAGVPAAGSSRPAARG